MNNPRKTGKLLKELSRDPELKRAIAKAKRHPGGKEVKTVENVTSVFLLALDVASHFVKKKRARAIEEAKDTIYLLVQVSMLLKENVFDRPEVKEFFSQSFRQIYSFAEEFVAMVLPKAKEVLPKAKGKGARTRRALQSV